MNSPSSDFNWLKFKYTCRATACVSGVGSNYSRPSWGYIFMQFGLVCLDQVQHLIMQKQLHGSRLTSLPSFFIQSKTSMSCHMGAEYCTPSLSLPTRPADCFFLIQFFFYHRQPRAACCLSLSDELSVMQLCWCSPKIISSNWATMYWLISFRLYKKKGS